MKGWVRLLNLLLAMGAASAFAIANGGQRVRLDFGLFTLRSVSLPLVVFGAVLLGMVIVLVAGLRRDLQNRRTLERYREALERREE